MDTVGRFIASYLKQRGRRPLHAHRRAERARDSGKAACLNVQIDPKIGAGR